MPVTMQFNANSIHASPAKRAALDEARVKARLERLNRVPGPGAYDVKRPSSSGRDFAGSSAFKSKTERKTDETLREVGDPGLYNPYENTSLGASMSRSFNKSQQSGSGNFGSRTKRTELTAPNDVPGPGTYEAREPARPEAKQSSAFASHTKRGAYLRKEVTPGAGEYDTTATPVKVIGGDSMFRNKDERFRKSVELEQQAHVGPGSYAQSNFTIKSETGKSASKLGAAFNTTAKKDWSLTAAVETPGPGAYNASRQASDSANFAGTSAFKSKTERKTDETLKEVGDPGLYNPYENTSLGASMSRSFNKSQQSGSGNFGSRTKRAELNVPNDAPGPGTYDAREPARPEAKQSSAFASHTKRGAYLRKEVTPGAGEYDTTATPVKVIGGDSMFRNKDERFRKSVELEQQAHVGPGSYSQSNFTIKSETGKSASTLGAAFNTTAKKDWSLTAAVETPGPGAYNASRQASDSANFAGTSAFKSKTERKTDETLKEVGDPGLYNPYENTSLGASMSRSFNKSQQSGSGNFGSRTKRAELNVPNDAPGPGTYDAREPARPEAKQGSAFASHTKRGAYLRKEVTPGAGEYDPQANEHIIGGESMFRSKDPRFRKNADLDQQAHIGPGSYMQTDNTVEKSFNSNVGKISSAFASTVLRDGFV